MAALELSNKYKTLLQKNGINTPLRLVHFFAQADHESGLKPKTESFNYSVEGVLKTFNTAKSKRILSETTRVMETTE